MTGALAGLGCDQGDPQIEPSLGPPLGLVATHPADGAGAECLPGSPEDCGVPINTTIELRFDRFLLPSTAVRQSVLIYTGDPTNQAPDQPFAAAPEPVYDVVERVVRFSFGEQRLKPRTLYTVELRVPAEDQPFGFRAFDGASIGAQRQPLRFSFYTSAVEEPPPAEPPVFACGDVLDWFAGGEGSGQCVRCHDNSGASAMGLDLSDGNGLLRTAVDRVAHQTDLGRTTGEIFDNSPRFGVGMPIVDAGTPGNAGFQGSPGSPHNSYLLYKLLIKPQNYAASPSGADDCTSVHRVAVGAECITPPAQELLRLREWFVRGEPMPFDEGLSLTREHLQGIQSWIRSGDRCQ